MTMAGQERRDERADARSSGLTNPAEVRRPSVSSMVTFETHSTRTSASFPPWRRCKRLKGISLPARLRLASAKNPRGPHGKNN